MPIDSRTIDGLRLDQLPPATVWGITKLMNEYSGDESKVAERLGLWKDHDPSSGQPSEIIGLLWSYYQTGSLVWWRGAIVAVVR